MLIDKYNRILIDKLPTNIASEVNQIAADTDNFSDEELVEIYKDNFNDLFKIIESKHPEALKAKKKLVKKASEKKKIVKKAEPKKKLVKKAEPKKKLVKKPEAKFKIGDEVFTYWDKRGLNACKDKTDECFIYKQGKIQKVTLNENRGDYTYNVKYAKGFYLVDESVLNKAEYISNAGDYIDLSMLAGKEIEVYVQGNKAPKLFKIKTAKVDDIKYSKREVHIQTTDNGEFEFSLSKLEAFLEGNEIRTTHDGPPVVIILKNASEIDCETAIAEIKAIHAKREAAAAKRAEAPKKKVTTAAREKQIKTIASVFKTKDFKADKKQAQGFAKDLVAVYSKYGLKSMADQLEKDIQELIDTKYK